MKKWIIAIGALLVLFGLLQCEKYLLDYNALTPYGKGIVWGSGLLVVLGSVLIFVGLKKKKTSP